MMTVCPACYGTGVGDGTMRGCLGGAQHGVCSACRGRAEVTETTRDRILSRQGLTLDEWISRYLAGEPHPC